MNNHINFIDVLRAFSVISVFFFHFSETYFPNAYLGVDIFFVISGFVITKVLVDEYNSEKKINLLNFYIRRFKRLYPALIVMLSFVLIFYILFTFQEDIIFVIKSYLSSLLGLSNVYYYFSETDYFVKFP